MGEIQWWQVAIRFELELHLHQRTWCFGRFCLALIQRQRAASCEQTTHLHAFQECHRVSTNFFLQPKPYRSSEDSTNVLWTFDGQSIWRNQACEVHGKAARQKALLLGFTYLTYPNLSQYLFYTHGDRPRLSGFQASCPEPWQTLPAVEALVPKHKTAHMNRPFQPSWTNDVCIIYSSNKNSIILVKRCKKLLKMPERILKGTKQHDPSEHLLKYLELQMKPGTSRSRRL